MKHLTEWGWSRVNLRTYSVCHYMPSNYLYSASKKQPISLVFICFLVRWGVYWKFLLNEEDPLKVDCWKEIWQENWNLIRIITIQLNRKTSMQHKVINVMAFEGSLLYCFNQLPAFLLFCRLLVTFDMKSLSLSLFLTNYWIKSDGSSKVKVKFISTL